MSDGLCQCGCGQLAPLSQKNSKTSNLVKGQPKRFIAGHQGTTPRPMIDVTEAGICIPLTRGLACLISPEDIDLAQYRWCAHHTGYAERHIPGTNQRGRLHRIVLERMLSRALQPGEECDHINGNRADNRRENLRLATHQQNTTNRLPTQPNRTGYPGVQYRRRRQRWEANIKVSGRIRYLGSFTSPEAAHDAYQRARAETFGEWQRETDHPSSPNTALI